MKKAPPPFGSGTREFEFEIEIRLLDFLVVAGNVLRVPYALELGIEAVRSPMPQVGYETSDKPFASVLGHLRAACFRYNPTFLSVVRLSAAVQGCEADNCVLACGNVHFLIFHNFSVFVSVTKIGKKSENSKFFFIRKCCIIYQHLPVDLPASAMLRILV